MFSRLGKKAAECSVQRAAHVSAHTHTHSGVEFTQA